MKLVRSLSRDRCSMREDRDAEFTVAYFRYDNGNPYQDLYFRSVEKQGVKLVAKDPARFSVKEIVDEADVVHFDWIHPYYKNASRVKSVLKSIYNAIRMEKLFTIPCFWTVHNLISHDSRLPARFEKACIRYFVERCRGLVVSSNFVKKELYREFPEARGKRIFEIPFGHYIDAYEPALSRSAACQMLGLPERGKVILFFGNLRSNKGIQELIATFVKVRRSEDMLLIAGGLPTKEVRDLLEEWAKDPQIRISVGFVRDREVPIYFGACDLVVLPFRNILNSGSSVLAASMSRCQVVPLIGSIPDHIPAVGRFGYDQRKDNGLEEALREALSCRDLVGRGERAKAEVQRTLDWDFIGKAALEMYSTVVRPGRAESNRFQKGVPEFD